MDHLAPDQIAGFDTVVLGPPPTAIEAVLNDRGVIAFAQVVAIDTGRVNVGDQDHAIAHVDESGQFCRYAISGF